MASLLGGMSAAPEPVKTPRSLPSAPPMRKRRSSPPPPAARRERDGKKPRVSFVKDEQPDGSSPMDIDAILRTGAGASVKDEAGGDFGMEMMGSPEWPASDGADDDVDELKLAAAAKGKAAAAADEDDSDEEMGVQTKKRAVASATAAAPAKRVNASAIKAKPAIVKPKPADDDEVMTDDGAIVPPPAWLSLADSLMTASTPPQPSSDDLRSSPPPAVARKKAAADGPATTNVDAFVPSTDGAEDTPDAGGTLRMFWLDFFEQEVKTDDGTVKHLYLIGKVWDRAAKGGSRDGKPGKWVSCCLKVDGLERNLFVCPRERTHSACPPPCPLALPSSCALPRRRVLTRAVRTLSRPLSQGPADRHDPRPARHLLRV